VKDFAGQGKARCARRARCAELNLPSFMDGGWVTDL